MRMTRSRFFTKAVLAVALIFSVTFGVAGCGGKTDTAAASVSSSVMSAAGPLLSSLGGAVPGLSQAQSVIGAGSLLGLAKAKMPAESFSQVSNAVPGTDALISEAQKQGLPSQPSGLSEVTGFLEKAGISSSQVSQMIPALGKAVGGKVSPDVANAFMAALK
jgi:hypothetical protein